MPTEVISVTSGVDDAYEHAGNYTFNNTSQHLIGYSGSARYNIGMLFDVPTIAKTDTIDSVDLELVQVGSGDINSNVRANAVDNAADFSSDPDVTVRVNSAATVAFTPWIDVDHGGGDTISSITDGLDLNAVVQEVIERAAWSPGNALVIFLESLSSPTKYFYCASFDHATKSPPKISITYSVGGGGPVTIASRRLLSGTGR